uniref:Uncharacterized protein n=1 Tax=Anguilla anguilla TaxID=7936 RepID=A0A0E9XYJ2_ANGAN
MNRERETTPSCYPTE